MRSLRSNGLACAALASILAACVVDPPRPPEQEVRYVPTPYPVKEPCFKEEDRPPLPLYTFNSEAEIEAATPRQLALGLHADRLEDCRYMNAIEALFLACQAKEGKPTAALPPRECGAEAPAQPKGPK